MEIGSHPTYPYLESINTSYRSKRKRVFNEILVNFERKRVKILITYECEFEIVKYANNVLAFRKDASPKSCPESKKLLKIVKLGQKLPSRICLGQAKCWLRKLNLEIKGMRGNVIRNEKIFAFFPSYYE